jgi:hypothetical protein
VLSEFHRHSLLGCAQATLVNFGCPYSTCGTTAAPSQREKTEWGLETLTLDPTRVLLRDRFGVLLKQLDVRSQARLAPVGSRVSAPAELFKLEKEFADGRDRVGIERVDLGSEDGDTHFACQFRSIQTASVRESSTTLVRGTAAYRRRAHRYRGGRRTALSASGSVSSRPRYRSSGTCTG